MSKSKMTAAQAKMVARLWSSWEAHNGIPVLVDGYVDPTTKACISKGFIEPTGAGGELPSGAPVAYYRTSSAGLRALGEFLTATDGCTE